MNFPKFKNVNELNTEKLLKCLSAELILITHIAKTS